MTYSRLLGIDRGPDADVFNAPVLEPELAQSWERSPDGLTFTFQMTPGVTWQNVEPLDGRPFVAEDARFALERYATEGVHQAYYANVSGFEAVDDATLTITMAKPTADFLNPLGSNKQTIFPRELVDDGSIATRAVGTGPMILTQLESGQNVVFERNPDYWEREVLLDGFEFKIMPDLAARTAAFRVGQLDYAYSLTANLQALEKILDTNPDVQINLHPVTYSVFTVAMNLTLPKYQDERVRRAISLALDRDLMIDVVMDGLGKTLGVIPWPIMYEELPTVESGQLGRWLTYNPDEAMKLLQAAGAEGLEMESIYYPYSSNEEKNAEIIQANLSEVGIDMSGGAVDYTEFNSNWVPAQLPDSTTSGWTTSGFDADNWFHGQVHSESPGNRWRINDPEIDAWAEEQQLELDPEARREIWQKIWDKDLDMMYRPTVPYSNSIQVYHPWVRGIRWTGSAPGDNSSYYNWGDQVAHAWLDK
jgi:ABC-type transport system substrate-binding protein